MSDYWVRLAEYGDSCTGYGVDFYHEAAREHFEKYRALWESNGKPALQLHRTRASLVAMLEQAIPEAGPLQTSAGHCFNTGDMAEVDRFEAACPPMTRHDWRPGYRRSLRSISEHVCVAKWFALYVVCGFPPPPA